jgi:hypothetical protein
MRSEVLKTPKSRVAIRSIEEFGISTLQVLGYKGGSVLGSEVVKC